MSGIAGSFRRAIKKARAEKEAEIIASFSRSFKLTNTTAQVRAAAKKRLDVLIAQAKRAA